MKTFAIILAGAALVAAQAPSNIDACGQSCINGMINKAQTEFGCSAGNATCFCADSRFGFGLRDCADEACGAAVESQVVSFGLAYCSSAGVGGGSGAASAVTASATSTGGSGGSGSSGSNAPSSTPFTTSAIVSDSKTVGSTTLFTAVGASEAASASSAAANASNSAASVASSASSMAASVGSSASSAASKASAGASGSGSSSGGSSSSSGFACMMTASPMILGGGAIMAAYLGM